MRVLLRLAVVAIASVPAIAAVAQEAYFPKATLSDNPRSDQFSVDWYSRELKLLEEPSLFKQDNNPSSESYRFLWLRTFHHPIAIRLDLRPDGSSVLTTKVADGEAGFLRSIKHLLENTSRPLPREQAKAFLAQIKRVSFWSITSPVNENGCDGAEWIIEGVQHGEYHVVHQWSPEEGPIRELGLLFVFGLAQMNIPKDQIY